MNISFLKGSQLTQQLPLIKIKLPPYIYCWGWSMLLVEKHVASFITAGVYISFLAFKKFKLTHVPPNCIWMLESIIHFLKIQRLLEANLNIHESFSTKYENFFVVFPNELISHPCCEQEYNVTYVSRRTSHFALNFKIMHLI